MELIFLGTGSNNPSPHRGASSLALRVSGTSNIYLFDCGEGTQIQIQRSTIRASRITKIFITHLHGDHIFGLPGFLCTLSASPPISSLILYGPLGLREFIETTLRLSYSFLSFKYEIVEIIPNLYDGVDENIIKTTIEKQEKNERYRTVNINEDGSYHLISNEDNCSVYAVSIKHRVPSYGYVIVENDLPGKFDIKKLQDSGIKPGPFCSRLKLGETVTLDDGRILSPTDYVGPSRIGRRLVILGDCSDASNVIPFAQNCDVLVHECTHDDTLRDKAIDFGHSTPSIATLLAEKCNTKCLLLNHFSQRYKSKPIIESNIIENKENLNKKHKREDDNDEDNDDDDDVTVDLLLEQAKQATSRPVFIADDFFTYTIPLPK
ncbi:unnamed protein product [Rotaria sp. Silwood1]|nr:unnamed protein product [Rotaria sp. Silwood1]CAF3472517.1 unnamed protein product [Rotaria sp. Silwood1]CAF3538283.1 unnamed protein product [Rotaria sp. Silwood1]CAF4612520.1 unnamed protein product [Rotaria sp. Silwood1]CAF4668233.1 unnamed protein product [Rotaria sp. Silwood1]